MLLTAVRLLSSRSTHTRSQTHTHRQTRTQAYTHKHTRTYTLCTLKNAHTLTLTYALLRIHGHKRARTYIHTRAHTHTYTHTHTHTHTYTHARISPGSPTAAGHGCCCASTRRRPRAGRDPTHGRPACWAVPDKGPEGRAKHENAGREGGGVCVLCVCMDMCACAYWLCRRSWLGIRDYVKGCITEWGWEGVFLLRVCVGFCCQRTLCVGCVRCPCKSKAWKRKAWKSKAWKSKTEGGGARCKRAFSPCWGRRCVIFFANFHAKRRVLDHFQWKIVLVCATCYMTLKLWIRLPTSDTLFFTNAIC